MISNPIINDSLLFCNSFFPFYHTFLILLNLCCETALIAWFFPKIFLAKGKDLWYRVCNTIEVADTKKLREPTGADRSGGKSAEPAAQVWAHGGDSGNTRVTVCVDDAVALSAYVDKVVLYKVGRSACRLFLLSKPETGLIVHYTALEEIYYGHPKSEGLYRRPGHPFPR